MPGYRLDVGRHEGRTCGFREQPFPRIVCEHQLAIMQARLGGQKRLGRRAGWGHGHKVRDRQHPGARQCGVKLLLWQTVMGQILLQRICHTLAGGVGIRGTEIHVGQPQMRRVIKGIGGPASGFERFTEAEISLGAAVCHHAKPSALAGAILAQMPSDGARGIGLTGFDAVGYITGGKQGADINLFLLGQAGQR